MKREKNNWQKLIVDFLGGECSQCGSKNNLRLHHVLPLVHGGLNEMSNIAVVCTKCHMELHKAINTIFSQKHYTYGKWQQCSVCGNQAERAFVKSKVNYYFCEVCRYIFTNGLECDAMPSNESLKALEVEKAKFEYPDNYKKPTI